MIRRLEELSWYLSSTIRRGLRSLVETFPQGRSVSVARSPVSGARRANRKSLGERGRVPQMLGDFRARSRLCSLDQPEIGRFIMQAGWLDSFEPRMFGFAAISVLLQHCVLSLLYLCCCKLVPWPLYGYCRGIVCGNSEGLFACFLGTSGRGLTLLLVSLEFFSFFFLFLFFRVLFAFVSFNFRFIVQIVFLESRPRWNFLARSRLKGSLPGNWRNW